MTQGTAVAEDFGKPLKSTLENDNGTFLLEL